MDSSLWHSSPSLGEFCKLQLYCDLQLHDGIQRLRSSSVEGGSVEVRVHCLGFHCRVSSARGDGFVSQVAALN